MARRGGPGDAFLVARENDPGKSVSRLGHVNRVRYLQFRFPIISRALETENCHAYRYVRSTSVCRYLIFSVFNVSRKIVPPFRRRIIIVLHTYRFEFY